jgi:hypothetical protein
VFVAGSSFHQPRSLDRNALYLKVDPRLDLMRHPQPADDSEMISSGPAKRRGQKSIAGGRVRQGSERSGTVSLALTVKQPWASLIASGLKTIENRSWDRRAIVGKRIAIHAGKATPVEVKRGGRAGKISRADNPLGAIVCTAVVERFVTSSKNSWFLGPIGWVLKDIRPCTPIPCSGALGLWAIPPAIAKRLA